MSTLVRLAHHRWAIPVLAELHRTGGGRFVNLIHSLGVSRESLRRTLIALESYDLIHRNPGYGHPLRPEYLLTATGERLAEPSRVVIELLADLQATEVGLRKWSLPILNALAADRLRYSELRNALPGTTPRALTLALKDLEAAGLVSRVVTTSYPPTTNYGTTARAVPLALAAGRLTVS
ncbi:HxlR family transcriptional regulator [Kribbella orskensis]|uniref:HxlR family transcriptional regulator n=1 Tax=Kribbella orskensis TaxID=2512216 RepID=A0ABY2BUP3_9ACTN|nr:MULTISPECIES: winged helix-turn-helix transcriptional regulator [Kribbella]TCN44438.1 HxlR family transcriptional regulator [Kribbella sp. VKM Ac-2500]TCO31784.1 HxlR family transcriptional regulator [Kribbella orskensis]